MSENKSFLKGYFDSHAHLLDSRFEKDRFNMVEGMDGIINIVEPGENEEILDELLKYEKIWGTVGVHPHGAKNYSQKKPALLRILKKPRIVALGEIGLDFYYNNSEPQIQKNVFKSQLKIAEDKNLPVIVHSRAAFKETLEILSDYKIPKILIHCFTGTLDELKELSERGYYVAIGGVVTFKNAKALRSAVKEIDTERLLIETDSPYLSPEPVRGKRNEPSHIVHTAKKIAEIKNMKEETIKKITAENTKRFFDIK